MKKTFSIFILLASAILISVSCGKQAEVSPLPVDAPAVSRMIQFSLYSNKNFSNYNQRIQFSVFIRNSVNQTLWDSMLPLMSVKDIPNLANKIFIEKQVPHSDTSLLSTGFIYSIENVGVSWHIDTCHKSTAIKKIDFNFQ